jgi:hypothetical protein
MNMHDELELRRSLRALPRERDPGRDLWPGIEARLDPAAASHRHGGRRWMRFGAGIAAALVVAIGWLVGFGSHPPTPAAPPVVVLPAMQKTPLAREADALSLEFRLALQPFDAVGLPPPLAAAAQELDHSALQLRAAIEVHPEAPWLLDRLRHTYHQRLRLAQRAVAT